MKTKNQTRDPLESHTNKKSLKKEAHHLPSWGLTDRQICDLELLLNGGFAPLKGFMGKNDYNSVLDNMRLNDGLFWPIPITLSVEKSLAINIAIGDEVVLIDPEDNDLPMGILTVTEKIKVRAKTKNSDH